jgi:hypothetical protein
VLAVCLIQPITTYPRFVSAVSRNKFVASCNLDAVRLDLGNGGMQTMIADPLGLESVQAPTAGEFAQDALEFGRTA